MRDEWREKSENIIIVIIVILFCGALGTLLFLGFMTDEHQITLPSTPSDLSGKEANSSEYDY